MKKILSMILACLMIVSMTSFVGAVSLNDMGTAPPENSEDYLAVRPDGSRVVAAYRYKNGVREELSKAEYLEMNVSSAPYIKTPSKNDSPSESIQPYGVYDFYTYNEIYSLPEVEMNGFKKQNLHLCPQ